MCIGKKKYNEKKNKNSCTHNLSWSLTGHLLNNYEQYYFLDLHLEPVHHPRLTAFQCKDLKPDNNINYYSVKRVVHTNRWQYCLV